MGGFYGSIHCRTADRQEVLDAVEYVSRKRQTRFLIGPPMSGWVTVYPENNGQDESISRALAKRLSCPWIHVLVHDDDIFAYFYYRDQRLADQFNSLPDYFGDVSAQKKRRLRGRPELLREFLADQTQLDALQELVTQDRSQQPVFAFESLARFAELLGLPNAVTSYEYLQDGERDDIQGWDTFVHVPDQSDQRAQARAAEEAQERLKEEGRLLVEESGQGTGAATTWPRFCAAPGGDGFLVFWGDSASHEQRPVRLYRSPQFAPPEDTALRLASTAFHLRPSHTGRFLGVGHASGNWSAEVWDLASAERVAHLPVKRMVEWIGFSPDDRHVITLSEQEFLVNNVEGGGTVRSFSAPRAGRCGVGVHPTGTLIAGDGTGCLTLWDFLSGECRKRLFVGGKRNLAPLMQQTAKLVRQQLATFHGGDWEQELRQKLQAEMEKMKAQWQRLGSKGTALPGGMDVGKFMESMEKNLEDSVASMKRQMEQMAQPAAAAESLESSVVGAASITCLEISRDGHWVACGTSGGVLVFTWNELTAAAETPVPQHAVSNPPMTHRQGGAEVTVPSYTQTLAFDEAGRRLLFAGEEGIVWDLDLGSGITAVLLDPPQRRGIVQMALSGDRRGLCCVCRPLADRGHGPPVMQIWSYASLDEGRLRLVSPDA